MRPTYSCFKDRITLYNVVPAGLEHVMYCCICMYYMHMYAVPFEAGRGHQMAWSWSHRWLLFVAWVLRSDLWLSARAACSLSC